ncbi:bifunctional nicotinamidase/pyrazinamidase [Sphingobacterium griseoflavum]|uniref:nicotinamidase n=1 Tax=Sphingobacterium griseoflavum TaxID=1474952 RepID=A0ABQ3I1C0_9SPHI|nr:bifunctional nicotinamidase/pyrazinamidase [Sphingobacterium griseoflavum]GHE46568.1 bifunctional pyrazinamidase/nicotinamidase [Sphingobacterium griseoflavum]
MKALIIVDVQYDFLPNGRLPVPEGDQVIAPINRIQGNYDVVVATQDWHPPDHQSFVSQHPESNLYDKITVQGLEQVIWPDHCVQGSVGAGIAADLDTYLVAAIFRKGMDREIDSYSGFFDNGYRKDTGLAGYLQAKGVDEVHVCGVAADYCVFFTAMDSLRKGFKTAIVLEATRAIDPHLFATKLDLFRAEGGTVCG